MAFDRQREKMKCVRKGGEIRGMNEDNIEARRKSRAKVRETTR